MQCALAALGYYSTQTGTATVKIISFWQPNLVSCEQSHNATFHSTTRTRILIQNDHGCHGVFYNDEN